MDEQAILKEIRSGNADAYASIVREYHVKVIGLCISVLGNRAEGEDAAQEIFIKAYRSLDKFRGDSKFSTWLYRIASNHCKDLLRKRSREKTQSWDEMVEREGEDAHRRLNAARDEGAADRGLVEALLDGLEPDERLILTLREVQALSYQEIASAMRCTVDAVKARLRRARAALQEKLRHKQALGIV